MDKHTQKIIDRVAENFDLYPHVVKKIVEHEFKWVAKMFREGDPEEGVYHTIRLHNFGVFGPIEKRIEKRKIERQRIKERYEQRRNDRSE